MEALQPIHVMLDINWLGLAGDSAKLMQAGLEVNQDAFVSKDPQCLLILDIFLIITGVNCGSLSNINNGQVSISPDTRFGSTATYSCNRGFELAGASQRRCRADARWSGSEPSCIRE